ncbi:MAG TPA: phosphatase PAP2 family protein [Alphaproteobacteria bacterium]
MEAVRPTRIGDSIKAAARRPSVIGFVVGAVGLGLLFWAFPGIDLWAASLFYRPGDGFFLKDSAFAQFFYEGVHIVTPVLIVFLVVLLAVAVVRGGRPLGFGVAAILYLILVFALGPGVLVNATLKDGWGRARPSQIVEFGGDREFTPAFVMSDQCERNCSFVAGHPSMLFGFFGFALLLAPGRRRAMAVAGVAVLGAMAGLGRMMQGGHFLSDVIFAGIFVYSVAWLLEKLLLDPGVAAWSQQKLTLRPGATAAFRSHPRVAALRGGVTRLGEAARAAARERPGAPPLSRGQRRVYAVLSGALLIAMVVAYLWIDRPLAEALRGLDGTVTHRVFEYVTQLGVSTGWLIGSFALFVGGWWASSRADSEAMRRRWADWSVRGLFVFACVAVPGLLTNLLKALFGRARPKLLFAHGDYGFQFLRFEADYWSFPSGHTTAAAGLAMAICLMRPRLWPVSLALALLVAASRVVLDRHYLSDTLGGAVLAIVVALALRRLFAERGARIFAPASGEH